MNYSNFLTTQPHPTKEENDTFYSGIGLSSKTQLKEHKTREDVKNYVYEIVDSLNPHFHTSGFSNTNLVEDRKNKTLTCYKHGIFKATIYNKYKFNLDDGCPECNKPKPKLVSYRCGEGEERFIEEGSLSHRCPNCVWGGKPYTFVHLNGMSYC